MLNDVIFTDATSQYVFHMLSIATECVNICHHTSDTNIKILEYSNFNDIIIVFCSRIKPFLKIYTYLFR